MYKNIVILKTKGYKKDTIEFTFFHLLTYFEAPVCPLPAAGQYFSILLRHHLYYLCIDHVQISLTLNHLPPK